MKIEVIDFIGLSISFIIFGFLFIKLFKWEMKSYADDEVMEYFSFKFIFFTFLLLFWVILVSMGVYEIVINRDKIFSPEILNSFAEINFDMNTIYKALPILIIMLLFAFLILVAIPIVCFIYFHRQKKYLKTQDLKNFTYKKLLRKYFIMSLTSPVFIPLIMGPNLLVGLLGAFPSHSTYYYTKTTDSKGNTIYTDTVINNDTGTGTMKITDDKGNKSIHVVHRY